MELYAIVLIVKYYLHLLDYLEALSKINYLIKNFIKCSRFFREAIYFGENQLKIHLFITRIAFSLVVLATFRIYEILNSNKKVIES